MAEFDLLDESSVGVLVRTRVKQYEESRPGCTVYAADRRGMWDLRFTCGKGKARNGTAYISAPNAAGWVLRIHWPGGTKGDIEKLDFVNTAGFEGLILKALEWEGAEPPKKKR
ncbi:MAG TPA: hypothetical protein VMT31_03380 [Methanomicrobiales archaeon]|jgi:hypothetical protein|nr:hypothetical protein [Methanomicrobiales archaeon]